MMERLWSRLVVVVVVVVVVGVAVMLPLDAGTALLARMPSYVSLS